MNLRLLHRILVAVVLGMLGCLNTTAQNSYEEYDVVAIRGIKRIYSLPENGEATFYWMCKDCDGVVIPISGGTNRIEYAFSQEGEYTMLCCSKDNASGCLSEETQARIIVLAAGFEVELGQDKWICPGDTITLSAQVREKHLDGNYEDLTYEWIGLGYNSKSIRVYESGTYEVKVTDKYGNSVYDVVNVDMYPEPVVDLGGEIVIAKGESVVLYTNDNFETYEWSTGETTDEIEVDKHGKYWLTATDINNCTASDTVKVFYEGEATPSGLVASLPNAFSPNNDGVNDFLVVRGSVSNIKKLSFIVYRRDGVKVFESKDINKGWDGKYKGVDQDIDGYIYFLKVVFDTDEVLTKRGAVSLLR